MKTLFTIHVIAQNKNGEFLMLQRAPHRSHPGNWNCVTGFIKERESAEEAALRELKEEANLDGNIIRTTEPWWKDVDDTRWVITSSLIEVTNEGDLKIDLDESCAHQWVTPKNPTAQQSDACMATLKQLHII